MSETREFEGRDLEEAIGAAAERLGIAQDDLHYEVLEQGRRGLLGLGTRNVRIRVKPPIEALSNDQILRGEDSAPPAPSVAPAAQKRPAPEPQRVERGPQVAQPTREGRERPRNGRAERRPRADRGRARSEDDERPPARVERRPDEPLPPAAGEVVQAVQRMLDLAQIELTAAAESGDRGILLSFEGPDLKLLTERRGELAGAFQFLLNRMARRAWPEIGRIQVAVDGGGEERDERLISMARNAAKQVSRTGHTKKLRPMNAYERRLVHLAVREFPGLTSLSDGEGSLKCVRISKIRNELNV